MTRITLRYFDGCPNWKLALDRIHEVLTVPDQGEVHVELERVETAEDAERLGFLGSPTVLVDGHDPFITDGGDVGLSCRVYRTERGYEGAPSVAQLHYALKLQTES